MKYKIGDKVRLVRDDGNCKISKEYRTKELTVTDSSIVPNLSFEGEYAGFEDEYNLIPSNAVIHTKTQAEYDRLMEELEKVGYKNGNDLPTTDYGWWDSEEDGLLINISGGQVNYMPASEHGRSFYEKEGINRIIPFTDIYGEVEEESVPKFVDDLEKPTRSINETFDQIWLQAVKEYYQKNYQEEPKKKTMLQKLSDTMKRVLNKDLQAQYKANFRDGDLDLTEEGRNALLDILAIEYEKQLAEKAEEKIKEEDNK